MADTLPPRVAVCAYLIGLGRTEEAYGQLTQTAPPFVAAETQEVVDQFCLLSTDAEKRGLHTLIKLLQQLAHQYTTGLVAHADCQLKMLLIDYDNKHGRISRMPAQLKRIPPARLHTITVAGKRNRDAGGQQRRPLLSALGVTLCGVALTLSCTWVFGDRVRGQ